LRRAVCERLIIFETNFLCHVTPLPPRGSRNVACFDCSFEVLGQVAVFACFVRLKPCFAVVAFLYRLDDPLAASFVVLEA
jgi:hypothetical protein